MRLLGRTARSEGTVYLVGGASAVLIGWREATVDIDMKLEPEPRGIFEAIAKIERGHELDLLDVREMARRGLVRVDRLRDFFDAIEPELPRYPAIDPQSFRRQVERVLTEVGRSAPETP